MNKNETNAAPIVPPTSASGCSALRPTDDEIDLEARQWAEEYATRCENTQTTRQAIFAQGARWARSVAQYSTPNVRVQATAHGQYDIRL